MKKRFVTLIISLALLLSFAAGALASGSGLLSGVWGQVEGDIRGQTDSLIQGLGREVAAKVEGELEDFAGYQVSRAEAELEEYYLILLDGLGDNPRLTELTDDLHHLTSALIAEEKARIDAAVAEMMMGR